MLVRGPPHTKSGPERGATRVYGELQYTSLYNRYTVHVISRQPMLIYHDCSNLISKPIQMYTPW